MASYDLSTLTVLIIDDNAYMRTILKTMLRGFGLRRIIEAGDAVAGLEELNMSSIDMVLVDFAMPQIDGIEFTTLVRKGNDSANSTVAIIMVSAYSERSQIETARNAGIDEFLCKPVCAAELYVRIAHIIEHPRSFVRSRNGFVGPDRRRKTVANLSHEERRVKTAQTEERVIL
ncbi:hypothetical protein MNBD_ALPHA09-914 [hydrothermal vent metagenome]|uniref:Response regulatory domain-containing protein n=1 Tax=hydrothermal vent metagenome TaxID=652676 RepID=A0A3B0SYQ2_9ZZZZ